jgi:membrane protein YdbS with pleckstrin-like domain
MTAELPGGEELRPSPRLRQLYGIDLILGVWGGILWWLIPIAIFLPPVITLAITVPILAIVLGVIAWLPRYHRSIVYRFTPGEIIWTRGVWFHETSIVPYNRITNIDLLQGPLQRRFGLSNLKVQTAGYSSQGSKAAELVLVGMDDPGRVRDRIMAKVREIGPQAAGTFSQPRPGVGTGEEMLKELVRIRELLESKR